MDIANLLTWKLPRRQWQLHGDDYAGLVWDKSNPEPKPTPDELETWWREYVAAREALAYREKRAGEYVARMVKVPNNSDPLQAIGDQFDIIWSCLESINEGNGLTAEAIDMLRIRAEIKARYPKP